MTDVGGILYLMKQKSVLVSYQNQNECVCVCICVLAQNSVLAKWVGDSSRGGGMKKYKKVESKTP